MTGFRTDDDCVALTPQPGSVSPARLRVRSDDGVAAYGLSATQALELAAALLKVAADGFAAEREQVTA